MISFSDWNIESIESCGGGEGFLDILCEEELPELIYIGIGVSTVLPNGFVVCGNLVSMLLIGDSSKELNEVLLDILRDELLEPITIGAWGGGNLVSMLLFDDSSKELNEGLLDTLRDCAGVFCLEEELL